MIKGLIFLFSFAIIQNMYAQAPQGLNYQAIARNIGGNIVSSQSIGVRFTILDGSASGMVVYQETHQAITNNFGVFTLSIGKGATLSGNFSGISWGSGTKFLKVEIAPLGGTLFQMQGTTQLLSVPYALYAEKSGSSGGQGPAGPKGSSILNGSINPTTIIGSNGDFYINTSTSQLFGPKANGLWASGTSLVGPVGPLGLQGTPGQPGAIGPTGPSGAPGQAGAMGVAGPIGPAGPVGLTGFTGLQGPQGITGLIGPKGPPGADGTNGKTVLNGTSNPNSSIGADGDFYINTISYQLYGPKTSGVWGTAVDMRGPAGTPGLKSLIDLENFSSNAICPLGGVIVKSGIDRNSNNVLESTEIDNTKNICFTQNAPLDKLIIIPLYFGAGVRTTSPLIDLGIIKFNKNNYPLVDSAILVADPYVATSGNSVILQLYNITDNTAITNGAIITNIPAPPGALPGFSQSANVFTSLPSYEITLGLSIQSSVAGMFAGVTRCYLYLYRP